MTTRHLPLRAILRWLLGILFVLAGINHFRSEAFYVRIIPPSFPKPRLLVQLSGVAEIAGGIGLLIKPIRRLAGWGLIALLVSVFPANVFMAVDSGQAGATNFPRWLLYARLPLQGILIAWAWYSMNPADKTTDRRLS